MRQATPYVGNVRAFASKLTLEELCRDRINSDAVREREESMKMGLDVALPRNVQLAGLRGWLPRKAMPGQFAGKLVALDRFRQLSPRPDLGPEFAAFLRRRYCDASLLPVSSINPDGASRVHAADFGACQLPKEQRRYQASRNPCRGL